MAHGQSEEQGVGGACDGWGSGASSERHSWGARRRRSEVRACERRRVGVRWENATAASRVRRGVRMKIRDMKMSKEYKKGEVVVHVT